jgi:succinate dehydrogenase / fumarate reductase flavoprotein subunit/fumarate reductase flavoprotein subunit
MTGMVLEEGLRGAGGVLTNALGERYMERYDPLRKERSTRDVVSRSSYMEIVAGRGTPQGGVYIDVSHLGAEVVQQMFPGMVERCTDFGYDLRRQPVEVSPTAHFHMGGVKIDAECHTDLAGLLAAGEDSGGTHGANRLGGNGVAESTVFGAVAGEVAAREADGVTLRQLDLAQVADIERRATQPLDGGPTGADPFAMRSALEALMWDNVGLVRDGAGMEGALDEIRALQSRAARLTVPSSRRLNLAWTEALDLQNLLQVAEAVTRSALLRTESRGAHYRSDFPHQDDARWLSNVYLRYEDGHEPRLWTEPVAFTRLAPPVAEAVTR